MWFLYSAISLLTGFLMDCLFGDPRWRYHPICIIGNLISSCEKYLLRNCSDSKRQVIAGRYLVFVVCIIVFAVCGIISAAAYLLSPYAYIVIDSIMCWFILAARSLAKESGKVQKELEVDDIEAARYAVSMIVGRDTKALDKKGITKAAVETVAENTSDGVIAPMLFSAIGGGAFGFLYKAINTMDSMVGYKNDRYINFGRCAAKLDDIVNFIPSRISAWLMIVSAKVLDMDYKNAKKIYIRDRFNHASPNSAQTESVCAGALDVELAGDAYYFGKLYKKKTIGDNIREIEVSDIKKANMLMYSSSVITLILAVGIKLVLYFIIKK